MGNRKGDYVPNETWDQNDVCNERSCQYGKSIQCHIGPIEMVLEKLGETPFELLKEW